MKQDTKTTREMAIEWFNSLSATMQDELSHKYYAFDAICLEDKEVEQIYLSEHPFHNKFAHDLIEGVKNISKEDNSVSFTSGEWDFGYGDSSGALGIYTKKMLDEGLMEHPICLISPIDKMNDTDMANAKRIVQAVNNYDSLKKENELLQQRNKELENNFYMDICRAFNAGKQNQINISLAKGTSDENKMFISSHDYFLSEFPDFKTNVP